MLSIGMADQRTETSSFSFSRWPSNQGVLVARNPEPPHIDLPVRAPGIVAGHNACFLREQFRQGLRCALRDLLGADNSHAYRRLEPALWKTCCGHDDGRFFRVLSER